MKQVNDDNMTQPAPKLIGRPRDPAKVEAIIEASWRLFLAHGVAPVAMETIAAEAGVAKATVYVYFPDKRALFQEGVRREMARIEAAQDAPVSTSAISDLRTVLIAFGNGIMEFLVSKPANDFYASLAGELRRDPELARMFYDAGPGRTKAKLADILASPLAADLVIPDPIAAADMLLGMWQGMSHFQLMLGVDDASVVANVAERVERGVTTFMIAFGS
jgi:TetR/AcrR family transcriptional regulator, mexJK operon transcriptional repressor